ncbi:MAG: DUF86 domain-containing protein [Deltaproteobacteria bacterium]|nr:DUF86 domain-containing protein [Deltaproteobacteria bacterium]
MLDRLKLLEENINGLIEFKNRHTLADIRSDKSKEWALRYGLLESLQIVVDISCHLTGKYNLGNPSTYAECIEFLKKYKYLDEDLADKLTGMVGLRNILVHEYITVDINKLYGLLDNIKDFKEFADKIKDLV